MGAPAGNVGPFTVQVLEAQWKPEILMPGMDRVPESQLKLMGAAAYAKPSHGFLQFALRITNAGKQPFAWELNPNYVPDYQLINAEGMKFQYSPQFSTIGIKAGGNLNPGLPVEGSVTFDVPPGAYTFQLNRVEWVSAGSRIERKYFNCAIN